MPRRADIVPREPEVDPVYGSKLVAQLINRLMVDGKKSTSEAIVYAALDKVGAQSGRVIARGQMTYKVNDSRSG